MDLEQWLNEKLNSLFIFFKTYSDKIKSDD
jgi:hypothetical protein